MDCIECKATNPDDNHFCGKCGAELGRTLDETVRKKGFRDRQATEMEITAAVIDRLVKWVGWLGAATGFILVVFTFMLGWNFHDLRETLKAGQGQIQLAVNQAKQDIEDARRPIPTLKNDVAELQSQVQHYKEVNQQIAQLQQGLKQVNDVIDLGKRGLRAKSLETTGPGESGINLGALGCSSVPKTGLSLCAQGDPASFFQMGSKGELRPVASLSPIGFQDTSTAAKPACSAANRGTLYVEKGAGNLADRPFLCARKSDGTYGWIQLSTAP